MQTSHFVYYRQKSYILLYCLEQMEFLHQKYYILHSKRYLQGHKKHLAFIISNLIKKNIHNILNSIKIFQEGSNTDSGSKRGVQ